MPNTLPTPVAAALGVIPTAIDTARRVPGKVVQLPILAISVALTRWAQAQQRYDDLAVRGERFLGQMRGHEPTAEDVDEWLAEPIPTYDDHDAVAQVTDLLDRAAERSPKRDSAATPAVVSLVEEVSESVSSGAPAHDELPLPDYDHMTLGSLRGRLRTLTVEQLLAIRDYEKAHADRLPVVTLLDNRIAKLALDHEENPQLTLTPAPKKRAAPAKARTS